MFISISGYSLMNSILALMLLGPVRKFYPAVLSMKQDKFAGVVMGYLIFNLWLSLYINFPIYDSSYIKRLGCFTAFGLPLEVYFWEGHPFGPQFGRVSLLTLTIPSELKGSLFILSQKTKQVL